MMAPRIACDATENLPRPGLLSELVSEVFRGPGVISTFRRRT